MKPATRWWRRCCPNADPLHKVTIIPRGMALGVTMQLPIDDKHSYNKDYLLAQLAILMGGRIAEEKYMHHMTTGAGNDIERATDLARKMVCEWGMSELGPLSFGKKEEQIFLGREIAQHRDYSEETAIRIDEQVKKLVQGGYDTARGNHRRALRRAGADRRDAARARNPGRQRSDAADQRRDAAAAGAGRPKDSEDHTQQVLRPEGGRGGCRDSPKGSGRSRRERDQTAVGRKGPGSRVNPRSPGFFRSGGPAFPVYLFDIDGTLLDSARDICGAVEQVLAGHRLPAGDFDYLRSFIGLHLTPLFQDVLPGRHGRADRRIYR